MAPLCRVSSSVEWSLPKPQRRVRFPYPAPKKNSTPPGCCSFLEKAGGNRTHGNADARWASAAASSKTGGVLTFRKAERSSIPVPVVGAPHRGAVLFWKKQEGIEPMEMQMPGGHLPPPVQKLVASMLSAKRKGNRFPYPTLGRMAPHRGAFLFGAGGNRTHGNADARWASAAASSKTGGVLTFREGERQSIPVPVVGAPHRGAVVFGAGGSRTAAVSLKTRGVPKWARLRGELQAPLVNWFRSATAPIRIPVMINTPNIP